MRIRIQENYLYNSLCNGNGIRMVIFFSGCKRNCLNCHNKELQDFSAGILRETDEIVLDVLDNLPLIDGVTLSGGDPLYQEEGLIELATKLKSKNIHITLYTGELFENISPIILDLIDSVVDGEFVEKLKDETFKHRGSSNQRIFNKINRMWEEQ